MRERKGKEEVKEGEKREGGDPLGFPCLTLLLAAAQLSSNHASHLLLPLLPQPPVQQD